MIAIKQEGSWPSRERKERAAARKEESDGRPTSPEEAKEASPTEVPVERKERDTEGVTAASADEASKEVTTEPAEGYKEVAAKEVTQEYQNSEAEDEQGEDIESVSEAGIEPPAYTDISNIRDEETLRRAYGETEPLSEERLERNRKSRASRRNRSLQEHRTLTSTTHSSATRT